jgi:hypothetical protein
MPTQLITAAGALGGSPLYHFTSFDLEHFAQVVGDSQIYFSKPEDFNDPFELFPVLDMDPGSIADAAEVQAAVVRCLGENLSHAHLGGGFGTMPIDLDNMQEVVRFWCNWGNKNLACILRKAYRVFCLSTELHDVVMWSHYGAKHRGIAFEFASEGDVFGRAFKVDYSDPPKPLDPTVDGPEEIHARGLLSKAKSWSHEVEYRVLGSDGAAAAATVRTSEGLASFPSGELKAVYVGCNMPRSHVDAVVNVVRKRKRDTPVRRMFQIPGTLKLEWKAIPPD